MTAQIIDISTPAALIRHRALTASGEAQFDELRPWFKHMLQQVPDREERIKLAAFIAQQIFRDYRGRELA